MKKSSIFWPLLLSATPSGSQTLSKAPSRYVNGVYPKILDRGKDGHVVDVDGREYIDLISGLGAVSVGYANQDVNREVVRQLSLGVSFSLPTMLEYHVSKRLCELFPETQMWKYGKNGVDATLMALRCARAYTGRKKILVHGYHGCSDHFECLGTRNNGMIDMSEFTVKYDGNLDDSDQSYAALIIEPYVFDKLDWKQAEEWCKKTGTVFIIDEIVSGGRMPGFSAYSYLGLHPDLVCVGKGLANGLPLSAVGGKRELMETMNRDDFFASTTFGGEAVSLVACLVTTDILLEALPGMIERGCEIQDVFNYKFEGAAVCKGFPTRLTFDFPTKEHKAVFMQEMCLRQVLVGYSNMIMATHTEEDVDHITRSIREVAALMKKHWHNITEILKGELPVEALRLRQNG